MASNYHEGSAKDVDIRFSHIQLYADRVLPLGEYKEFEGAMNKFHQEFYQYKDDATAETLTDDIQQGQQLWNSMQGDDAEDKTAFVPHGRDVVKVSSYQEHYFTLYLIF